MAGKVSKTQEVIHLFVIAIIYKAGACIVAVYRWAEQVSYQFFDSGSKRDMLQF